MQPYLTEKEQMSWRADEQIPKYLLIAKLVIVVLILGAGGWASVASISGAVIASGTVKVESNAKSVQHLEGGIVREILVVDGDTVKAGDVMIRLNASELLDEIRGLESQMEAKSTETVLIESELQGLEELAKQGLVPKTRLMALKRQAAKLNGERQQLDANVARIRSRLERLEVRAPISGVVHGLAVHTLGGVIAPGQEIMQIIPSADNLLVEARVDPKDIDQLAPQQSAKVRLTSFNQRTTPEVDASVSYIPADLTRDEANDTYFYRVLLEFKDGSRPAPGGKQLVPGMPAEVFISTEPRTALSYFVKPFTDQFRRAFREE